MTAFVIAATLLLISVLAILVVPLWRRPPVEAGTDRQPANLVVLRDQLAELERERAEGLLAETDFNSARSELQRRLLEENAPATVAATAPRGDRLTVLLLLLLIPLATTAGYLLLGNPRALDPLQRQARLAPEQVEAMVARLAERLRTNPDDAQGWVMLARSYKVLERYEQAADAYARASRVVDVDATLLADYADVLSRSQGGKLQGKPLSLIERALQVDPDEPQALLLAGAAASEREQFAAAAEYWRRLLPQLDPGSEEERALSAAIARASQIAVAGTARYSGNGQAASGAISGEVTLSKKVAAQVTAEDVVFVFVRADDGPRRPLAVVRAHGGDLPLRFRFDDSMVPAGGGRLSEASTLTIEARVAKAGRAESSVGDLFGRLRGVKPGSHDLRLLIDQVQR